MITVKFSSPPWNDFGFNNIGLIGQTPENKGLWGNYKFEINNDCNECDFWIIYSSTPQIENVKVPKGNTIFVTSEEHIQHYYIPKYLKQFDKIVTSRHDINGSNVIKDHYINAWFIRKTYDQLKSNIDISKTKTLSVIASNLVVHPGHRLRYEFVNKLMGHFKDKIDVFGKGFNFIEDKWDGLAPYKYSIAIENACIQNYFTEKIADCYLAETMPIYFGCPNINDYFDSKSMLSIDPKDFIESIRKIEQLIEEDTYSFRLDQIKKAKQQILNQYQFFPYITRILDSLENSDNKTFKKIYPESKFTNQLNFKSSLIDTYNLGKKCLKDFMTL
jgi:hypothetical protein